MKRTRRFMAALVAPVFLAGTLLAGSSAFHTTGSQVVPSDTIDFNATFFLGQGRFAIVSSACTLHDGRDRTDPIACKLVAGGEITDPTTKAAKSTVTITGTDGKIVFQQTAVGGCATGTGFEIDPADGHPVAIRVEATSSIRFVSDNVALVSGHVVVYENGALGTVCEPK